MITGAQPCGAANVQTMRTVDVAASASAVGSKARCWHNVFAENVRVSKVTDLNQQCLERLCLFARTTFNAAACSAVPMLSQLSQSPLSTCRSWYSWEAIHGGARRQSCR